MIANPRDIRGTNHTPCNANMRHNMQTFVNTARGGSWDEDVFRKEIEAIAAVGFNCVRLFWSPIAYAVHNAEFVANVNKAAEILAENGIMAMPVLMDSFSASHTYLGTTLPNQGPQMGPLYWVMTEKTEFDTEDYRWDPTASENPVLLNGTDGLLDLHFEQNEENFDSIYPNKEADFVGGGWLGTPDPLYVMVHEPATYPADPNGDTDLWAMIKQAIRELLDALQSNGVLHSVDLCNEPQQWWTGARVWTYDYSGNPYRHIAQEFPNKLDVLWNEAHCLKKCIAMMEWMNNFILDEYPGVLRTIGHVDPGSFGDWHEAFLAWVGAPESFRPGQFFEVDYISWHNYGFAPESGGSLIATRTYVDVTLAPAYPGNVGVDFVINEFGRYDGGFETMMPWYLWRLLENNAGGFMWDILEFPSFGNDQRGENIPDGTDLPSGEGYAFPGTGLMRSKIRNGQHVIVTRTPRTVELIKTWCNGTMVEPPWHEIRQTGHLQFEIFDGTLSPEDQVPEYAPDKRAYWRYAYLDPETLPDDPKSDISWLVDDGLFSYFNCAGLFLDLPGTSKVDGYCNHVFGIELLDAWPEGKVLVLQAIFGEQEYDLAKWEKLEYYTTTYLTLTKEQVESFQEEGDAYDALIYNRLVKTARNFPFRPIERLQDEEVASTGALIRPATVQAGPDGYTVEEADRRGPRSHRVTSSNWKLIVKFAKQVGLDSFLKQHSNIVIPRDQDNGREFQVRLIAVDVDVDTPVSRSPSSGTEATITYEANFT